MRLEWRWWVLVGVVGIAVVGGLGFYFWQREIAPHSIIYISGYANDSALVMLDPNASNCTKSEQMNLNIPNLDSVQWTTNNEIVYLAEPIRSTIAQYVLLNPITWQSTPIGAELNLNKDGITKIGISPTLRFIAVARKAERPGSDDLELRDVATGSSRQVMTDTLRFQWSPYQDQLVAETGAESRLFVVGPEMKPNKEYHTAVAGEYFVWLNDGDQIAFATPYGLDGNIGPADEIYRIELKSGQTRQVTTNKSEFVDRSVAYLAASPNHQYLSFLSSFTRLNGEKEVNALYVLDGKSGLEVKIADNVELNTPVWDKSGERIAFVEGKPMENGEIYVYDLASGMKTQLTCDAKPKTYLSWYWGGLGVSVLN